MSIFFLEVITIARSHLRDWITGSFYTAFGIISRFLLVSLDDFLFVDLQSQFLKKIGNIVRLTLATLATVFTCNFITFNCRIN